MVGKWHKSRENSARLALASPSDRSDKPINLQVSRKPSEKAKGSRLIAFLQAQFFFGEPTFFAKRLFSSFHATIGRKATIALSPSLNTTATQSKTDAFCMEIVYHFESPKKCEFNTGNLLTFQYYVQYLWIFHKKSVSLQSVNENHQRDVD